MFFDSFSQQEPQLMPIVARFRFETDRAEDFSEDSNEIVEMVFDDPKEIEAFAEEFSDAIVEVTILVNGRVLSLSDFVTESN